MCLEHLLATQRRRPDDKAGTTKDLCHALTLNPVLAPYGKFFIDSKPEGSFLSFFFFFLNFFSTAKTIALAPPINFLTSSSACSKQPSCKRGEKKRR